MPTGVQEWVAAAVSVDVITWECSQVQSAVTAGTLLFDGSQLSACESGIASQSCDDVVDLWIPDFGPSSCQALFHGTVPDGGACDSLRPCVAGEYCDTTASCPGTCRALASMGSDCTHGQICQPGLACTASSSASARCEPPLGPGASCATSSSPGYAFCAPGLFCDIYAAPSTCKPQLPSGSTCYSGECATGLVCVGGSHAELGVCGPPVGAGGACTLGRDGCAPGMFCNGGACAELSDVGGLCGDFSTGNPLDNSAFVKCRGQAYCNPGPGGSGSGTCASDVPLGGACSSTTACVLGASCGGSSSGACTSTSCNGVLLPY